MHEVFELGTELQEATLNREIKSEEEITNGMLLAYDKLGKPYEALQFTDSVDEADLGVQGRYQLIGANGEAMAEGEECEMAVVAARWRRRAQHMSSMARGCE